MKDVVINLSVNSLSENEQSPGFRPCPRINVFEHPAEPTDILEIGNYTYSIKLEDNGRCGVDAFGWMNNEIDIVTDLPVTTEFAGGNLDQIQKTVNITESGIYNISISVN